MKRPEKPKGNKPFNHYKCCTGCEADGQFKGRIEMHDEWEKFIDDFVYKILPEIMKQAINSEDAEDLIRDYLRGE